MPLAPILLFTYNRPTHTQQTLNALLNNESCDESELFVFSDGYKDDSDKENVLKVREIIKSTNGFKQIHIVENEQNLGLAKNIITGVSKIINKYGKVIVLEDDLITSPCFLTFMNEALDRFEHEEKIGHVHAFCYQDLNLPDTFLITWTGSWGWATWRRAWQHFNPDGKALLKELKRRKQTKTFDFNSSYPYTRMLRRQVNGINNSWAIRWSASLFLADILSLNAGKSLIQNIGLDGSGTHSGKDDAWITRLHHQRLNIELSEIKENILARKAFEEYYRKTNSVWVKINRRINRFLRTNKI